MGNIKSPDSKTLATAGENGIVKLWNVPTRREVATIRLEVDYLAFSPDGPVLACHDVDGTLHLLQTPSLREIDNPARN